MLDLELMKKIAAALMTQSELTVSDQTLRVQRTGTNRLRRVEFVMNGGQYAAIEQNPYKPSRWGTLARQGHQVVQFLDLNTRHYIAVAIDGEIKQYGKLGKK
ncbi:MAG TPA: hypothetical protein VFA89_11295 [Terriglobales bacterium]|nr:hypothetical protein [Terriglobales bacterium]